MRASSTPTICTSNVAVLRGGAREATVQHRLDHETFGLVCGEDGKKFKTRSGDVVRLVDLLDEAVERMHKGMVARNEEAAAAKAEAAAAADGDAGGGAAHGRRAERRRDEGGGARPRNLSPSSTPTSKGNRNSNYIFSFDRMLDPRGDTAVYLLYAGARLCGILRKAGADGDANRTALVGRATLTLGDDAEMALGRELLRFQEVQEGRRRRCCPTRSCEYAYAARTSAEEITDFYVKCKVLGTPEQARAASSSTPPSPPCASRSSSSASASSSASEILPTRQTRITHRARHKLLERRAKLLVRRHAVAAGVDVLAARREDARRRCATTRAARARRSRP